MRCELNGQQLAQGNFSPQALHSWKQKNNLLSNRDIGIFFTSVITEEK